MRRDIVLPALHQAQASIWEGRARYNSVCIGRRSGKSVMGVMLAAGASASHDLSEGAIQGYPVGWFAPTYRVLDDAWRETKRRLAPLIVEKSETSKRIALVTGGSIEFWTLEDEDAGRSRKYKRVIVDEAAMARHLKKAWEDAIRPTLTDYRGDAWFFSTPKGRNFFHELWMRGAKGRSGYRSWQMPTSCNPFIAPEEVEEARQTLPERVFRQEYLAEFLTDGGGVFHRVTDAIDNSLNRPLGSIRDIQDGRAYVVGVDWGRHNDFTVFTVLDAREKVVIGLDRFTDIEYSIQLARLRAISARFPRAPVIAESNSMGGPLIEQLKADGIPVRAFQTTAASKASIIEGLAMAFERSEIRIPDNEHLTRELLAFDQERLPSGALRYSAPPGEHDDCVMSLAIAWHGIGRASGREPVVFGGRVFS